MPQATYKIGKPIKPTIRHDNGFLDKFSKRTPTLGDKASYAFWYAKMETAEAAQGVPLVPHNSISDGLAAYRHFMEGNGNKRWFSYERYVLNDPSGRITLKNIITEAKQGAILLFQTALKGQPLPLNFQMTGSALSANSKSSTFPYPLTENWQKAIGAHSFWISADVLVDKDRAGKLNFKMQMTVHVEDMYNFNPGAKDIATGIPDKANGIFSLTGLAHQYLNVSTLARTIKWESLTISAPTTVNDKPFLRVRQPSNNRRIRNKL